MQPFEIQEISREIKVRGMISDLLAEMRAKRPTLSRDTIYRALDRPEAYTVLLDEIRQTAKLMLRENTAVQEAA